MGPEWVERRLYGRMLKPDLFGKDPVTSTIRQVVESLLDDADVQKAAEQRLEYTRALCNAVAHEASTTWILPELLKSNNKTEGNLSARPENMLAGAAAVGDMDKLRILLSQGTDPNVKSEYFGFALQNAARLGLRAMVLLLLEHECASLGQATTAALEAACEAGQEQIVECLLNSQSRIHISDGDYETAVVAAAGNGHVDLMWLLLNRDGFLNKENVMAEALFTASERGYLEVVLTLLDSGLDVNKRNHENRNSLHRAVLHGHASVVRLLLNRGVYYYDEPRGDPLWLAAINGHEDVVQILLDNGADIDADGPHLCVFSQAARHGESRMLRFLLEKGIDLHASYRGAIRGAIALEEAAAQGHEDTVRLLVGLGVDLNGQKDRDCPMLRAMMANYPHIVKTLLELGAEEVDPLQSDSAPYFLAGQFPQGWRS